ncbi:FadR/GntR family transcriptional regulator [Saccharopolyspora phatthalungensis]|uniref:GntR family transcriptional repressor for pyruvate dehydrogenase complex n=1 Tax=Saccharopolyspora phatthalungensis TaxID=664693 RepID=A0A840Q4I5_9PSEU|nr:FCD domain-containing protein [Saccharopolyspora phatthalungensis]MBB5153275.1 GntR family transcriptional repressor for pyruvate dehydrogenase complex [Saccharopolyspora phatthalungensis]
MGRSSDAIEKIRRLIATGELRPGSRLPREPDLAAQLGLSRSSMREAVTALVYAQVLDVRRGDGTYVTSLEPHRLLAGIAHAVELMQDGTLPEIFELRRLLEPQATALAAERITPERLAELREHLDAMRRSETIDEFVVHDAEFHATIMAATRNRTLISVVNGLAARALRVRTWNSLNIADARQRIISRRQAIYQALEKGDAALALSWATVHVTDSERDLLRTVPSAAPTEVG